MTRKGARLFALWSTGLATVAFLALTVDSHQQFPTLTNSSDITGEVKKGKEVWHKYNCINCHTLFGEGAYYAPDLTKIAQHRGEAYIKAYMKDPSQFYDENKHRRSGERSPPELIRHPLHHTPGTAQNAQTNTLTS